MERLVGLIRKLERLPIFSAGHLLCLLILGAMGANLISNAAFRSLTNDEFVHIPSGHRYLVKRDFTLNPEHPPLAKVWAALPLALVHVRPLPSVERNHDDFVAATVNYSAQFWELNRGHWWQIVFWSRVPIIVLTLGLGVLIYLYGKTFFGVRAALFAVALFSLEPTMLAHGWIVHTDLPAAFGFLLFFVMLQKYCLNPSLARSICLGVVTGVALLIKFSLIVIAPVFFCALVYRTLRQGTFRSSRLRRFAHSILAAACAIVVINAGYFFQHPELSSQDLNWFLTNAPSPASREPLFHLFNLLSKIFPTYYLFGIFTVYVHNHQGHPASLLGDFRSSGWWYYFPTALLLKTSLPFLLLTVAAVRWAFWAALSRREKLLVPIFAFAALYFGMAMTSRINIGVRHIAPVFPFLFLLGGIFLDRFLRTRAHYSKRILVTLTLASMVLVAVRAYPDYLSFMNSLKLEKPGWQLLSDSNVEWGEDTGALARYLHEKGETSIMAALSGGWLTPYGIRVIDYAPPDLQSSPTRYVAIGAASLNGSTVRGDLKDGTGKTLTEDERINYFANYRRLVPEKVFGNSIYLYRKTE